jgi:hypothetical protein
LTTLKAGKPLSGFPTPAAKPLARAGRTAGVTARRAYVDGRDHSKNRNATGKVFVDYRSCQIDDGEVLKRPT